MNDILTITLNPAVDLATSVEHVIAGPKLYCKTPLIHPGGGGVNVARAICKLGGQATALVAVGGPTGERLLDLLASEAVPTSPVPVSGETRESFAVTDETTGQQYRFSVPGPTLSAQDGQSLLAAIGAAVTPDSFVVLSGGLAAGLDVTFPDRILAAIKPVSDRLIVDTSRGALAHLIQRRADPVHLLRIDQKEAAQAAEHAMATVADSVTFAQTLVDRGVARIVVTGRGADGSIMVTQTQAFFCHAPKVTVRSKIGAGDAFVGAMTLALARGAPPDQALRWGVAAASATVGTQGTALCERQMTEDLFEDCIIEVI
ncbi:1-phosphofructokinase family hexose kinase [Yoonia sediminilitoris]|uniref:1-phosphofructokinase family hexose kinase n=1 Tax=Yoonia sediminilitoris TaxID=1286148 RepID=UPI000D3B2AF4|nr:1-phosphofructokinase family hexose kinase [Yoonia sediminilitoris]